MPRLTVPIHLRWSDLDAYRHVNNATMLRLLEEARVRTFWEGERGIGDGVLTLIARQEIEYLAPMSYSGEPILIELWLSRIGGASLEIAYQVRGPEGDETVYARAATVVVFVDAATGKPTRLDEATRARWEPYLDDPIAFRRGG